MQIDGKIEHIKECIKEIEEKHTEFVCMGIDAMEARAYLYLKLDLLEGKVYLQTSGKDV